MLPEGSHRRVEGSVDDGLLRINWFIFMIFSSFLNMKKQRREINGRGGEGTKAKIGGTGREGRELTDKVLGDQNGNGEMKHEMTT